MVLLEAKHLRKQFGTQTAVNDISLKINTGDLVAFLGPNGAGKSTTISLLIGTLLADAGDIQLDGQQPTSAAYHRRIGVVFQESVLDAQLTVRQNLQLRASMYRHLDRQRVAEVLKQFQLTTIANQRYGTLSGGQRRRVDIARAIIHHPDLLILDEPSTGLDIQTRQVIWQVLTNLRQSEHLTILLTTHYLEEAEQADFVYVIDHGELVAADTVAALKQNYAPTVLNLTTTRPEAVRALLPNRWQATVTTDGLRVTIPDTLASLPVLPKLQPFITNFELRNGTIDDLFLTLTGREIR